MRGMTAAAAVACLAGMPALGMAQAAQAPTAGTQAQARGVGDPRQFVEQTYARYRAAPNTPPEDPVYSYSDRLRSLFSAYDAWQRQHDDLVGSIDFDWWTNSQDWSDIRVTQLREERRGPNRRTIVARIVDMDVESVNRFQFVRQGNRWFLDDVVNGSGRANSGWTLSALLRERPE
jgi:hypothetical protein